MSPIKVIRVTPLHVQDVSTFLAGSITTIEASKIQKLENEISADDFKARFPREVYLKIEPILPSIP
jgi:hypothetical protein